RGGDRNSGDLAPRSLGVRILNELEGGDVAGPAARHRHEVDSLSELSHATNRTAVRAHVERKDSGVRGVGIPPLKPSVIEHLGGAPWRPRVPGRREDHGGLTGIDLLNGDARGRHTVPLSLPDTRESR